MDVRKVNVHEAKTQLSKLLQEVENGEQIVIARDGEPVAMLVPYVAPPAKRQLGEGRGTVLWIADDFDELPEDMAKAFGMIDDPDEPVIHVRDPDEPVLHVKEKAKDKKK